jgi:hypothetical protein
LEKKNQNTPRLWSAHAGRGPSSNEKSLFASFSPEKEGLALQRIQGISMSEIPAAPPPTMPPAEPPPPGGPEVPPIPVELPPEPRLPEPPPLRV